MTSTRMRPPRLTKHQNLLFPDRRVTPEISTPVERDCSAADGAIFTFGLKTGVAHTLQRGPGRAKPLAA